MTRSRASAKKAGTAFESSICAYLAKVLDDDRIERRARSGGKDRGDVSGMRVHGQRLVVEAKNCARMDLPGWTREAHIEAGNDDALVGVVVSKRHGVADPARQWVHMELADLVRLMTGQPLSVDEGEDADDCVLDPKIAPRASQGAAMVHGSSPQPDRKDEP